MKNKQWLAVVALLGGVYAGSASAELVIGAKVGAVDIDLEGYDAGTAGSVQIGYEFLNLGVADIAIEGELVTSLTDPQNQFDQDVSFDSLGVYASIRTAGPIYVIGRVGMANVEVGEVDDTDTSTGIGVGFSVGLRWELEYTKYEVEGVDVEYLSLGLSF